MLSSFDFIIICSYLALVLFNGVRASRHVKDMEDFATGGKSYSSFIIFATLSASFIGGGFTSGLAEKVFKFGLIYIIGLWGFSLKEILVAKYIAPKMGQFKDAHSVGDIMGQLYGKKAKIFTGLASFLVCAGIIGAQFSALGYLANTLLGISAKTASVIGACIIIFYAGLGGMRAVVANDTLHFCILIIALPLVLIFGIHHIGGVDVFMNAALKAPSEPLEGTAIFFIFLSFFFGETLVPPYVQRLLIGKDIKSTVQGNWWSGLVSIPFFLIVGSIGLVAFIMSPNLNPNLALPHALLNVLPIGLKGLAVAGMIAVIMSSADSFLNAASVAVNHDVLHPLLGSRIERQKLKISRGVTCVIALGGLVFSLQLESAVDILLQSYVFWTPIIVVPFVAGVLGIHRSVQTFWNAAFTGVLVVMIIQMTHSCHSAYFEVSIWGVLANAIVFFGPRSVLNFPSFIILNFPSFIIRKLLKKNS
jgi:solute:Na+ symporter, SSS family